MKASKTNSCLVLMGSSEASYEHRFLREYEAPPPVGVLEVKALARKDGGARHASSWEGGGRGNVFVFKGVRMSPCCGDTAVKFRKRIFSLLLFLITRHIFLFFSFLSGNHP